MLTIRPGFEFCVITLTCSVADAPIDRLALFFLPAVVDRAILYCPLAIIYSVHSRASLRYPASWLIASSEQEERIPV